MLLFRNKEKKPARHVFILYFKITWNRCNEKKKNILPRELIVPRLIIEFFAQKRWKKYIGREEDFLVRLYPLTREPLSKRVEREEERSPAPLPPPPPHPSPLFHGSVPRIINSFLISPILG